jgi:multisubunit Na+/H+ antiporter MnhC subunit
MTFFIGCLFFLIGLAFILRDTFAGYVYGIIALGNGVNLIIFSVSDVHFNSFPFIGHESSMQADPLPQALVLTAIVISFATLCFVIAVIKKIIQSEEQS